jgi:hypothetical protein
MSSGEVGILEDQGCHSYYCFLLLSNTLINELNYYYYYYYYYFMCEICVMLQVDHGFYATWLTNI